MEGSFVQVREEGEVEGVREYQGEVGGVRVSGGGGRSQRASGEWPGGVSTLSSSDETHISAGRGGPRGREGKIINKK